MSKLKIEYKDISELIPYINNPRINDGAVDKVASSIKNFGFKNPIIIDKDNEIIAGHTRLKAARKLGLDEVPTIKVEDLTDNQIKAFRIADNKTSEFAEWDMELLEIELEGLDNEFTGFDIDELGELFNDDTEVTEDDFDEEPPEEPISKRGDIWLLGKHRLMCGDSTNVDDVDALMDGNKVDMVFTDPPYGIDYSGGRTQVVESKDYGKLVNDDLEGEALGNLICNVFNYQKEEADIYICVSPIMQKPFLDFIESAKRDINAVIVWDKKQPGLGYMAYRRQCEFILFLKGKPYKKGDASDFDLWSISRDNATTYIHGTQKPIAVSARAMQNSSKKEDRVLDLFGGSGSTLIACEQLDRICYMMELDEKYVDVIVNRYISFKESDEDVFLIRDGTQIHYKEVEKNE